MGNNGLGAAKTARKMRAGRYGTPPRKRSGDGQSGAGGLGGPPRDGGKRDPSWPAPFTVRVPTRARTEIGVASGGSGAVVRGPSIDDV